MTEEVSPTAARALAAYGGEKLWRTATRIEAEVSAGGLAFTIKRRPPLTHSKIEMEAAEPQSRLCPVGTDRDVVGVLDGGDVRLEGPDGSPLSQRSNARSVFPYGRRLVRWDDLDITYFANYAFWNYFTLPRLLLSPEVSWTETRPGTLDARFHGPLPTHNERQTFTFDLATGRLERHDYTVDIISPLAKAANVVVEHAVNDDGVAYPSVRKVTPQGPRGAALPGPVLLDLRIHSFQVT